MKTKRFSAISSAMVMGLLFVAGSLWAQQPAIQYFRPYDQRGLNVFETTKDDSTEFEGLKVRFGANFAQQYQKLSHTNQANFVGEVNRNELYQLSGGFNLAMANLNIDAQLADGLRVSLVSYMSSRHHSEFWVKGGYFQIDKVGFLNSPVLNDIWKNLTLKVGHMEINYGDAHFRRSDGGNTLFNPFVENNLVDAFATEIGGELYWQKFGAIAMLGITDGEIQGSVTKPDDRKPSIYGKIGYDRQFTGDLRARLTGSFYTTKSSISNTLYAGDRTGSHYYLVMEPTTATASANYASGRINPGFKDNVTAFVVNPFVKFRNIELFGTYEIAKGNSAIENGELQSTDPAQPVLNKLDDREFTQLAVDLLYRFSQDRFYVGAKYNTVEGDLAFGQSTTQPAIAQGVRANVTVDRTALAAGWFITRNVLFKAEYVVQKYKDFPVSDLRSGGKFDGFVVEGIIGF